MPGWHLDAICEHLEAVTRGEIRNLLINMPPRHMKSLAVSVFWPVWVWLKKPEFRWLFSSYALSLSIRDSLKCRRLIESRWFQDQWSGAFALTGDQNAKLKFDNDKRGYRIATSVGGAATGEGGDAVVCFPFYETVQTEDGPISIGEIVENRLRIRALSWNRETGAAEMRQITGWHTNSPSKLVQVITDAGSLVCTPDHKILCNTGFCRADSLRSASLVATIDIGEGRRGNSPKPPIANGVHGGTLNAISPCSDGSRFRRYENISCLLARDFCSRLSDSRIAVHVNAIPDILRSCAVGQVLRTGISRVAIKVSHVMANRAWADECEGDQYVGFNMPSASIDAKNCTRIPVGFSEFEDASGNRKRNPSPHYGSRQTAHSADGGGFIARKTGNLMPFFRRVISVNDAGFAGKTYCISVEHNHTFIVGNGSIVSNCDDPHNVQERESDPIRESTLSWWDQVMSTRLNDPKLGSKVVVMQRVHEKDLSGHILSQGGYVHLCLPAEFECNRRCITEVGWEDPRREPGELLWPARIGPKEIADFKVRLGSAGYAGQFQQSPTPAGGARFKRQWFRYFKRSIDDKGIHYYQLFQPDGSIVRFKVDECTRFSIIDPAGAEKEQNNKPCFTVIGAFDLTPAGDILWFDLYRKNASIPDIAGDAVVFYRQHDLPWIGVERDGLGLGLFQIMRKRGIAVRPIKARGSKEARSETAEILMESGRIYFLQDAVWLPNLQHELELFPVGEFADQVDVLSYAALWANRHTSAARKDEDDRVEQEHTKTMNKQTAEAEKITAAEDRRAAYNPADAWFGYGEDD